MNRKNILWICYYNDGQDTNFFTFVSKVGNDNVAWQIIRNEGYSVSEIDGIYPIEDEMDIDGNIYKIKLERIKK